MYRISSGKLDHVLTKQKAYSDKTDLGYIEVESYNASASYTKKIKFVPTSTKVQESVVNPSAPSSFPRA